MNVGAVKGFPAWEWNTFKTADSSQNIHWIKAERCERRSGRNLNLRRQLSDFIRRARLLSDPLRPTILSAKWKATGFYGAAMGRHSGGIKHSVCCFPDSLI